MFSMLEANKYVFHLYLIKPLSEILFKFLLEKLETQASNEQNSALTLPL